MLDPKLVPLVAIVESIVMDDELIELKCRAKCSETIAKQASATSAYYYPVNS